MQRDILLLGEPALYESSSEVTLEQVPMIDDWVEDLRDTLLAFRKRYHAGRAIAAPQIGIKKRVVYRNLNGIETIFINPRLLFGDDDMFELWDDCMSFPNLLVRVMRHARCTVIYRDRDWTEHTVRLEGDMSELLQHECDHLDGILATMRAIDDKSFKSSFRS